MLLEKSISPDDVVVVKLGTGEELIAKLLEHANESITLGKPLVLNLGVDPKTNQIGLQMIPTFMLAANPDARFKISMSHVICISKAADDAKNGYIRNTTNLVVPGQQNRLQL